MNQQPSFIFNILFNLVIPVYLLNNSAEWFPSNGPLFALVLALSFPLGYGVWDYIKEKKANALSILGICNVVVTGGLALAELEGIWFAVKEAAFPLMIGIAIAISSFSKKPFIGKFLESSGILPWALIQERIQAGNNQGLWVQLQKRATLFLSLSFLVSSIVNFVLAIYIFTEIDPSLSADEKSIVLNKQIADMTWIGFLVLFVPSMIMTGLIFWYLMKGLSKLTGLPIEDLINNEPQAQTKPADAHFDSSDSGASPGSSD